MPLSHYDTLAYLRRWKLIHGHSSITTDQAFEVARQLELKSMPPMARRRNRRGLLMYYAQHVLRPAVEAGYLQRMPRSTWRISGPPALDGRDMDNDFVNLWWHTYGQQKVQPWQLALLKHPEITAPTGHGRAIQAGRIVSRLLRREEPVLGKAIEVYDTMWPKKYSLSPQSTHRPASDADADFLRQWWETLGSRAMYTWQLTAAVSDPRITAQTERGRAVQLGMIVARLVRSSPHAGMSIEHTFDSRGYSMYSISHKNTSN